MSSPTPANRTLFQAFEWHTPSTPPAPHETRSTNSHYARLIRLLPALATLGITSIWLPPGCKANSPQGNGYDCYDLFDLGEFNQKGTRSTRWGSCEELRELIRKAKEYQLDVIWDAVLNHKAGADSTEDVWAVEVDKEDRRYEVCPPKKIEAWLRFDFPGRQQKYSSMRWRSEHFNGTDWDHRDQKTAIYKFIDDPATLSKPFRQPQRPKAPMPPARGRLSLMSRFSGMTVTQPSVQAAAPPARRPGKGWSEDVDDLHGNFDYLMFSNIDYTHPEAREEVTKWGQWMVNEIGVDGFRLDAVQHFSYSFTKDWIRRINEAGLKRKGANGEVFMVGEIWTGEYQRILRWLNGVQQPHGPQVYAYDAPLLYNFSRISEDLRVPAKRKNLDLRTIARESLLLSRPRASVTLVTNHDTQPGQTSYTPIIAQLKPLFYAFILLRQEGLPCVFWGDLYGTKGPHAEPPIGLVEGVSGSQRSLLADLMMCRKLFAYGEQVDHFDAPTCIGWTRAGTKDRPGCAVLIGIGIASKSQRMKMAIGRSGGVWLDILGNVEDEVKIDANGVGSFPCRGISVSVYVEKHASGMEKFPLAFSANVYESR